MKIMIDDMKKQCSILVPIKEREIYKGDVRYKETISQYTRKGYNIGVYISGNEPLLHNLSDLLQHQDRPPVC
jgi:hypothetical protein